MRDTTTTNQRGQAMKKIFIISKDGNVIRAYKQTRNAAQAIVNYLLEEEGINIKLKTVIGIINDNDMGAGPKFSQYGYAVSVQKLR